jgi:hypothetical protein
VMTTVATFTNSTIFNFYSAEYSRDCLEIPWCSFASFPLALMVKSNRPGTVQEYGFVWG